MEFNEMIADIRQASTEDRLVVFIGAGVSNNSGFVDWNTLVGNMEYTLKKNRKDKYEDWELLRIPQYLKHHEEDKYKEIIKKSFDKEFFKTNEIIDKVLELNPKHIITTNFDKLIEYSIQENDFLNGKIKGIGNKYFVIRNDYDFIKANKNNMLIKMHGDFDDIDNIVLAEEDYLSYSINHILSLH